MQKILRDSERLADNEGEFERISDNSVNIWINIYIIIRNSNLFLSSPNNKNILQGMGYCWGGSNV